MATIVMESAKVIEACEKTIAHIEARRTEDNENAIAYAMRPIKLLGFTFKGRTREKAIKHLMEYRWGVFPSSYAWGDMRKARDLLRLAQLGDPVTLNEDDCRAIF